MFNVFSELQSALSLWDRWRRAVRPPEENLATRFVRALETHGVHRNQIPRLLNSRVTLADVRSDESLILKLDDQMLDDVCQLLGVNRSWMDGANQTAYKVRTLEIEPDSFSAFLDQMLLNLPASGVDGLVLAPMEPMCDTSAAVLVLQEEVRRSERSLHRFHVFDMGPFYYWKARAYLAACAAHAWRRKVYVQGRYCSSALLTQLLEAHNPIGWDGEGVFAVGGQHWHPEDLALEPATFLHGVDPERKRFGHKAALEFWLALEQQGHMETGMKQRDVRAKFESALAALRA